MRRALAIIVSLALALAMGVMSAKPAAAADPDFDTFPYVYSASVEPETVVFASGIATVPIKLTIQLYEASPTDWVYRNTYLQSVDEDTITGSMRLDSSTLNGNIRELVYSGRVPNTFYEGTPIRGWQYLYSQSNYYWKDAPESEYGVSGYSYVHAVGDGRLALTGPARINTGASLSLAGKLECFRTNSYAQPRSWNEVQVEFREAGSDTWRDMGSADYNEDNGEFKYFNLSVGATGDWRVRSYEGEDCAAATSAALNVVAGNEDPPEPPATSNAPAMVVSAKTHKTVTLNWTAPTQPGGKIEAYRIGWSSANGLPVPEWSRVYPADEMDDPFTMTNLAAENEYTMWIEAITPAGTGDRTTLKVTTNAAPPPPPKPVVKVPTAPRALKVAPAARTAKVSWVAPASNGGAAINAYQVKRGSAVTTLRGTARSYTYGGLRPLTRHAVYVRAHNAKGWGPWVGKAYYTKAPAAKAYRSCAALNYDYPHGVGKPGAKDKGTGVTTFYRSSKTYKMNDGRVKKKHQYDLDRDNDKIACEKR